MNLYESIKNNLKESEVSDIKKIMNILSKIQKGAGVDNTSIDNIVFDIGTENLEDVDATIDFIETIPEIELNTDDEDIMTATLTFEDDFDAEKFKTISTSIEKNIGKDNVSVGQASFIINIMDLEEDQVNKIIDILETIPQLEVDTEDPELISANLIFY